MRIVLLATLTFTLLAWAMKPVHGDTNAVIGRPVRLPSVPFNYSQVELPAHFTAVIGSHDNTPSSNLITDAGATLGRVLFYDRTLSVNGTVSCASCHKQELAFSDGQRLSTGFDGARVSRNSMSLINTRYYSNGRFFWDERAETLEEQVLMPIENTVEMGHSLEALIPQLESDPIYPPLFENAFSDPRVSSERVSKALAQFIRSIVSFRSKYDEGRSTANSVHDPFSNFSAEENFGKQLFLDQGGCADCHLFDEKQDLGEHRQSAFFFLDRALVNGVDGKVEGRDPGVGARTGRQQEVGAFKVASLRNVALTGPYMHDGRFTTLDRVIEHYNWGVRPHPNLDSRVGEEADRVVLNELQKVALTAFLETLTDQALIEDQRFSDPFVRESE